MAKPRHGRYNIVPRFPSQAALSALALLAPAPSVVAGAPLPTHPPAFLCPFIEHDTILARAHAPSSSTSSKCEVVADKYVQGPDNLWRKTDTWTLYGSTCQSGLAGSTSDIASQANSSQSSAPISTPSPNDLDTSILPIGWENTSTPRSSTDSNIILALAIVLAGSICVFMIGCVIWRRRTKRARDIERKLGCKRGAQHDSQDNRREKDARGRMRAWAKATARWRSDIRQSARRRRKRHTVSSTVNRQHSSRLSLDAPSAPSPRRSITFEVPDSPRPDAILSLSGNVSEPPAVLHDPPRPALPPTYGASFLARSSRTPPSSAAPSPSSTSSPVGPYSAQHSNPSSSIGDEPLPYIPPSDGHVATDDKSRLAHIGELASSPPPMITDAASSCAVSAPQWHEVEDDLEDLDIILSKVPTSFHNFDLPPSFPSPPPEADVHSPFHYLDDHPLRYGEGDDISVSLPFSGSPASPSAPPLDDPVLEPSAPCLEGEEELSQDWDGASSDVPEVHISADPDSAHVCTIDSSISSAVISASRASSLSTLNFAVRDGILPRYHP